MWKEIANWPYMVSDAGEIWSLTEDRLLSTKSNTVRLQRDGESISCIVSRLVAEAFLPNPFNYPMVEHIDNDKSNNSVENLRWVAKQDQSREAVVNKLRDSAAKRYGYIHGIGPNGEEVIFRSHREGEKLTGVSKSSIGSAIQTKRLTKGWTFYRD